MLYGSKGLVLGLGLINKKRVFLERNLASNTFICVFRSTMSGVQKILKHT